MSKVGGGDCVAAKADAINASADQVSWLGWPSVRFLMVTKSYKYLAIGLLFPNLYL